MFRTLLSLLAAWPLAASAVPLDVAWQGRLVGPSGAAVEGTHSVRFALYAAATGGSAIWSQTTSLPVDDGYFSTVLEDVDPDDLTGNTLYVGVTIDSGTELSPRTALSSVPFALVAASVQGSVVPGAPGTCGPSNQGGLAWDNTAQQLKICHGTVWKVAWRATTGTQDNPGVSCETIHAEDGGAPSGLYWIAPLGGTTFQVECDMTTDGGGWTLIANISDAGTDVWSQFTPAQDTGLWQSAATLGTTPSHTADYKSQAFNDLVGTDLLISHDDAPARTILYANACWPAQTFRAFMAGLTWRAAGSDANWSDASGAHLCSYTNLGYNDPVLRATGSSQIGFKWGEANGVQDSNRDRVMITATNSNGSAHQVDAPTGIGGFTDRSGGPFYEDANECQGDSPSDCANATQNYGLWVR